MATDRDDRDTQIEDEAEEAMATPPKKSGAMIWAIVGIAGLAGGAWLGFGNRSDGATAGTVGEQATEVAAARGPVVELETFIVNLADADALHYLKAGVAIELASSAHAAALETQKVRVRNAVLLALSSLTLSETQGVENKRKIQDQLRGQVAELLGAQAIQTIYFTSFVIQ